MSKLYPVLITILLGLVLGLYFFGPKEIFLKHQCMIQKTGQCVVEQEGIAVDLTISPNPIIPTEDLTYELKLKGIKAKKVTVRLLGHDMEMPRDEQVFDLESFLKPDEYKGTRTFPTCTEKVMTWRIYLVIQGEQSVVRTTFDLEVKRPH